VNEPLATSPGGPEVATRLRRLHQVLAATARPVHDLGMKPAVSDSAGLVGHTAGSTMTGGLWDRRRLHGRLAAVFFAGSGTLGLATLPLPAPGADVAPTAAVYATALILGVAIWLAPWQQWTQRASLAVVPPAFALIALGNTFGGTDLHTYGVFFVVAFVWIGMTQPPRTSAAMAPLAAAAYIIPVFLLPGGVGAGLTSAAITIPLCVLVGEGIAWGVGKLEQIELSLARERDRAAQLRALDEAKDKFLSAVSHELRTPITICRGHLEVLEEEADTQEIRAVKEMLIDELGLMSRLVEDLSTLARADDQSLLQLESLPLDSFMNGIEAQAKAILGDRLRAESRLHGASLRADPQRLTQALMNLLQNAAEHTKGDGPVCFRVLAEASSWRFEVTDDGGGLPVGDEQAFFEAFSTGSSWRQGTGLGLSIVRGIARAHGGDVGVVNRPGLGATFWIRIPR
jgi:signal transduction histidine kinase